MGASMIAVGSSPRIPSETRKRWNCRKAERRRATVPLDSFALAAAAVLLTIEGGRIARIAIAIGGAAATPLKMAAAEACLVGETPTEANFLRAAATCGDIDALDDAHAPAAYRRHLAGVMMVRALRDASRRALT